MIMLFNIIIITFRQKRFDKYTERKKKRCILKKTGLWKWLQNYYIFSVAITKGCKIKYHRLLSKS